MEAHNLLNIDEMHKEESMKLIEKRQRDCAGGHVTGRRDRLILTLSWVRSS